MNIRMIFGCLCFAASVFLCGLQMLFFPITDRPAGVSLLALGFMTVFALCLGGLACGLPGRGPLAIAVTALAVSLGGLVWGGLAALVASPRMNWLEYAMLSAYIILYAGFGLAFASQVKLPTSKV